MTPVDAGPQTQVRIPIETPPGLPPAAPLRRPVLLLLAGVVLPVIAIAVELATRACAEIFFDPIPTPWHVALVTLAPLANLLVWLRPRRKPWNSPALLSGVNAAAIVIAAYYAIRFLAILPLAIVMVVFLVGLLPQAPLLSLCASVWMRRKYLRSHRLRYGFAAAFAAIAILDGPVGVTRLGVSLYRSGQESAKDPALRLLRCCGSEAELRKTDDRILFHRVTGKPWDTPIAGLALTSSRVDGSVDPAASFGYLEWTMLFRNTSPARQEARSTILLPPGGVVSRATLWVNGEEREAAFGGRAQTTHAYERVVSFQRDPLLVVTNGPDRVQVRCFPVFPQGEMKIRLGITAPLEASGKLRMPRITGSNFAAARGLEHTLAIDASRRSLRRRVRELPDSLDFPAPAATLSFTDDPRQPERFQIVQRGELRNPAPPARLIVVVDGSAPLKPHVRAIRAMVASTSKQMPVDLLVASAEVLTPQWLSASRFVGGVDSEPALMRARDIAAENPGSAILWIHGPQPRGVTEAGKTLRGLWTRRRGVAPLYAFEAAPGQNDLLAALESVPGATVARGNLEEAFALAAGSAPRMVISRERVKAMKERDGHRASLHVARLWAHEEVLRLARTGRASDRKAALALSRDFQLVTPVSGAVVLETEQQYKAAGLKPVDPATVPTVVPEPATWVLIGSALVALILHRRWAASLSPRGPRA